MINILFVDDDRKYLNSLERVFRKQNQWVLHFATDVDSALEVLKEQRMDLIISDMLMPNKSGLDLLKTLKKDNSLKTIPVIMITGQNDIKMKAKSLDLGCADFINKPFDQIELLSRINSCLRLKKYQDQIIEQNVELEKEIIARRNHLRLATKISSFLVKEESLEGLLDKCCQSIVTLIDVALTRIWVLDASEQQLELKASAGIYTHLDGGHQFVSFDGCKIGRVAQKKTKIIANAIAEDTQITDPSWLKKEKIVSFAGYPLLIKNKLVGVMGMFSKHQFTNSVIETLASVADSIAIGIDKKNSEAKAHFYSFYDTLTQLPNRRFLNIFLGKMVNYANRYQTKFAFVLIDIDDFNRINDSLGHITGDRCLKILSQRIIDTLRTSDYLAKLSNDDPPIARIGGDEFAILLQQASDIQQINKVINRLVKNLSKSIHLSDRDLILSFSVGIARYPDDGDSILSLYNNTEKALMNAKEMKKGGVSYYSESMNRASVEMLDLEINLRKAIKKKAFCLYYQPKVKVGTNKVIGAEALIRWQTEDNKMVSPAKFIPLAEKTGLIVSIDEWVIETVCHQNALWQKKNKKKIPIAVNVSGLHFGQEDFIDKIQNSLKRSGLPPEYLELEITETTLMQNPKQAIQNLNKLKEAKIKISLDDFGTGYSSLAYLQKLPIDHLKIDISFIRNLLSNPNDAAMVKAIIAMAHKLGLSVIAEGVEDVRQLEYLALIDCDIIQGYFFSPPLPDGEFASLLSETFDFGDKDETLMSATVNPKDSNQKLSKSITLQWQDAFCVGQKTIDEQHKKWFNILHLTQNRLTGNLKYPIQKIGSHALKDMLEYTKYHFSYEEQFMKKQGFSEFNHHKTLHDKLIAQLNQIDKDLKNGTIILNTQIISIMESWFLNHILVEDRKIKESISG